MDNKSKLMVAAMGVAAIVVAGYGIYSRIRGKNGEAAASVEATQITAQPAEGNPTFTDPGYDTNHYLTKVEAANRSALVSDVSYNIILGLVKGGKTYHGKITIDYKLNAVAPAYVPDGDNTKCLFIDYKGKEIRSITVNDVQLTSGNAENLWINHRIYIPPSFQKVGSNRAVIEFETYYVTDCQGF